VFVGHIHFRLLVAAGCDYPEALVRRQIVAARPLLLGLRCIWIFPLFPRAIRLPEAPRERMPQVGSNDDRLRAVRILADEAVDPVHDCIAAAKRGSSRSLLHLIGDRSRNLPMDDCGRLT
jgi:hypothetical protein